MHFDVDRKELSFTPIAAINQPSYLEWSHSLLLNAILTPFWVDRWQSLSI